MRQANLALGCFVKTAVGESGRSEEREAPCLDVRTHRFQPVECQRRSPVYIGMEQPDPFVQPDRVQGHYHLGSGDPE